MDRIIDNFNDAILQKQLIEVYKLIGKKESWLGPDGVGFFNNNSNLTYAKDVMAFFNRVIPKYTGISTNISLWKGTNAAKDFAFDCHRFLSACKYFKLFGFPMQENKGNCQLMKDTVSVINNEKENVLQKRSGDWGEQEMSVLNSMKTYLEQQQAKLSCNLYLTQSEQQYQIDTMTKVTDAAISSPKSSQDTAVTKYAIYGVIAVIVIMIFIKMFR